MSNITSVNGAVNFFPPSTGGSAPAPASVSAGAKSTPAHAEPVPSRPGEAPAASAMAMPSAQELHAAVSSMQTKMSAISPELLFQVDQASGRSMVVMTDRNTKDVLWQFPSEAAMQISKALDVFQKGALLNRKA
jgi:flagellar protein FlaG